MLAVKGNRSYRVIDDYDKEVRIKEGYDIIDDSGKLIAYGAGKTVPYEQYMKVVEELEALKAKSAKRVEKKTEK